MKFIKATGRPYTVGMNLIVWGDSIARGVTYDEAKNHYTVCLNTFDRALRAKGVLVKNYAKPGCTSLAALPLMEKCEAANGALVALEFGGNDSDLAWAEVAKSPDIPHSAAVSLDEYAQAIIRMAKRAKEGGMRPVVVTPLPVAAEKYFRWISKDLDEKPILEYLGSAQYIYRWQERYAYVAMAAAREANCPVFDLRSRFLARRNFENLMCLDGIHPNPDGYQLIRDSVLDEWQKCSASA